MLNKSRYSCSITDVPKSLISSKLSNDEYYIKKIIGKEIKKSILDENGEEITISILWDLIEESSIEENFLILSTAHGPIKVYNYTCFFRVLTGIDIDEKIIKIKEQFSVVLSFMPKPIVEIFGHLLLNNKENSDIECKFCLPLKISSIDYTEIINISASYEFWTSLLKQSLWEKNNKINDKEYLFPKFSHCSIGKSKIHIDDYKNLDKGDIFILDDMFFNTDGIGIVTIGDRYASVLIDDFLLDKRRVKFLNWYEND